MENKGTDAPVTGTKEEVESVQESLVMDVCEFYGRPYDERDKEQPSMRATAEHFGISALKVKKILLTGGLFQTQLSDEIQAMYLSGLSMNEIAAKKQMSVPNVGSYLPYSRVIYNLDVRNEEAGKALMWRQKQANRIIGRPAAVVQTLFNNTLQEFQTVFESPLNVCLATCVPEDGSIVLSHLARSKGYNVPIPAGMTIEEYVGSCDGIPLMYGTDDKGGDVDTILLRADRPDLKETILHLLAQIYCRRYEVEGGFFYRDYCCDGDALEQKIMQTGYSIWSGYITEKMVDKVMGRETWPEDTEKDVQEMIRTCSPVLMSWILLNGGNDKLGGTCAAAKNHGEDYHIDREFIWRLGCIFLLECEGLQMDEMRTRLKERQRDHDVLDNGIRYLNVEEYLKSL